MHTLTIMMSDDQQWHCAAKSTLKTTGCQISILR